MERKALRSSNLNSVGYEPETETLEVEFSSGAVYQYTRVPQSVYDSLCKAASPGALFADQVKSRYRFKRIG